jgi:TonB family protein
MNFKLTGIVLAGFLITSAPALAQVTEDKVYTTVESSAIYPGGNENFQRYLDANTRYPEEARRNNINAKIYLSFVVEKDGSLSNIKLLNNAGYGCDEEAIRLIKASQKWIPAKQNGAFVRQMRNAVVMFGTSRAPQPVRIKDVQIGSSDFSGVRIDEPVGSSDVKKAGPNEIYTAVEHSAEYPGGIQAFYNYLAKNLRYPPIAKANDVTGKVLVTFVVEKDGRLTDMKVIRGVGSGCDEEALRVIKASEKWLPGKMLNGKVVRQQYTLPITFSDTSQPVMPGSSKVAITSSQQTSIASSATDRQNMIYTTAEEQAAYPGGPLAFSEYVKKNLKYPVTARTSSIQGKVFITFVIERDGTLNDIKVLRGVRADIDAEAIRLVKASGKWMPAKYRNAAVRQQYTLPVSFDLY